MAAFVPSARYTISQQRRYLTLWACACGLALSLVLSGNLKAQETPISFERLITQEGLSNYSITALLQDRQGFLWVGTQGGLNRYDGHTFRVFDPNNSALSDDHVTALHETVDGLIWVGTYASGVFSYDPVTETLTPRWPRTDESHAIIEALHGDETGTLWIGTRGAGLYGLDTTADTVMSFRRQRATSDALVSDTVWTVRASSSDPSVVWIGTELGLNRLDLGNGQVTQYEDTDGTRDAVHAIYEHEAGHLWIGTGKRGLRRFNGNTGQFESRDYLYESGQAQGPSPGRVRVLYEDVEDRTLWAGTSSGGLYHIDIQNRQVERFLHIPGDPASLAHNGVSATMKDRAGVLWVGTWGGLSKYTPSRTRFAHHTYQPNVPGTLRHPRVLALAEDGDGMLWVGTEAGLSRWNRTRDRFENVNLQGVTGTIWALAYRQGTLWIGTRGRVLYALDPRTQRVTSYDLETPGQDGLNDIIMKIYPSPSESDILWLGGKPGLTAFDTRSGEVVHHYEHDENDSTSLGAKRVWTIHEDRAGTLWVGTYDGGLNRLNRTVNRVDDTFTRYLYDPADSNSLSNNRVMSILEDQAGTLWVGTMGGFNRFDAATGRFTRYTEHSHGLPDTNIMGLLKSNEGYLWMSTENGLARFNPRDQRLTTYDTRDGLQSAIFHSATYKDATGTLFFGGENGFNAFQPASIRANPHVPPVVITDLQVNDRRPAALDSSITTKKSWTFEHDENTLVFSYAALDFTMPSRNRYKYTLDGADTDWIDADNQNSVRYSNLQPGRYTFRVRASNNDDTWNEEGTYVHVYVKHPWWQRWWAYSTYLALLIGIAWTGYQRRVRRLQGFADQLEIEVATRTQELKSEKEKTEAQAQSLMKLERQKDTLFKNITHDFRTPLTLILSPIQGALDGRYGTLDEPLEQLFGMMLRNSQRLNVLVDQLIDLTKLDVGHLKLRAARRDLIPFLRDIVFVFAPLADKKQITLSLHDPPPACWLYFDHRELDKVITNLLDNAFKFTEPHGKILVRVNEVTRGEQPMVEISIKDTGRGIAAEDLTRIFERFGQGGDAHYQKAGTGIGLHLAKALVELHHGTITVESELGFGSTFFVRLPMGHAHLTADEINSSPEPQETTRPSKARARADQRVFEGGTTADAGAGMSSSDTEGAPLILIVEDHPDMRALLRERLQELYQVIEAPDGREGLALIRKDAPDLVISDVMMPHLDGFDLCHTIKSDPDLDHTPVMLLTARDTKEDELKGLGHKADAYITKPFDFAILLQKVDNVLGFTKTLRDKFTDEVKLGPEGVLVPSAEKQFIQRLHEVIEQYMDDSRFSVEWLADELCMGRRQIQRKVKTLLNMSPSAYIRHMRMARAMQLLAANTYTVKEVAAHIGFRDAAHFSKVFKHHVGISPSQYPDESDKDVS